MPHHVGRSRKKYGKEGSSLGGQGKWFVHRLRGCRRRHEHSPTTGPRVDTIAGAQGRNGTAACAQGCDSTMASIRGSEVRRPVGAQWQDCRRAGTQRHDGWRTTARRRDGWRTGARWHNGLRTRGKGLSWTTAGGDLGLHTVLRGTARAGPECKAPRGRGQSARHCGVGAWAGGAMRTRPGREVLGGQGLSARRYPAYLHGHHAIWCICCMVI